MSGRTDESKPTDLAQQPVIVPAPREEAQLILESASEREGEQAKEYYSQGLKFYRVSFWAAIVTASVGCIGFLACVAMLFVDSRSDLTVSYQNQVLDRDAQRSELSQAEQELKEHEQRLAELLDELVAAASNAGARVSSVEDDAGSGAEATTPETFTNPITSERDRLIDEARQESKGLTAEAPQFFLLPASSTQTGGFMDMASWSKDPTFEQLAKISSIARQSLGRGRIAELTLDVNDGRLQIGLPSLPNKHDVKPSPTLTRILGVADTVDLKTADPTGSSHSRLRSDGPDLSLLWFRTHVDVLLEGSAILVDETQILSDTYRNLPNNDSGAGAAETTGLDVAKLIAAAAEEKKRAMFLAGLLDMASIVLVQQPYSWQTPPHGDGPSNPMEEVGSDDSESPPGDTDGPTLAGDTTLTPFTPEESHLLVYTIRTLLESLPETADPSQPPLGEIEREQLASLDFVNDCLDELAAEWGSDAPDSNPAPVSWRSVVVPQVAGDEDPEEVAEFVFAQLMADRPPRDTLRASFTPHVSKPSFIDSLRSDIVRLAISQYRLGARILKAKARPRELVVEQLRMDAESRLKTLLEERQSAIDGYLEKQGQRRKIESEIKDLRSRIDSRLRPRLAELQEGVDEKLKLLEQSRQQSAGFLAEKAGPLIGAIAAAVVQLVGGLFLLLANRTQRTASSDFDRARADRRFRQAFVIVEQIDDGDLRNQCNARMALELSGADSKDLEPPADDGDS